MSTKTIPAVVEVYCDVCGEKVVNSRFEAAVTIDRYEYVLGERHGKRQRTYDLCDACGEKVAEVLTPKTK